MLPRSKHRVMRSVQNIVLSCLIMLSAAASAIANITVPFTMINGLIIVEAEVNGELGNYIIDSGVNGVVINDAKPGNEEFVTLDGAIGGQDVSIDELRLGNFVQRKVEGFSTDLSSVESFASMKLGGILGCSVFTPHAFIFDFENFEIRILEEEVHSEKDIFSYEAEFSIRDELPFCTIDINGNNYNFILDSGATSHFIDFEASKSLGTYISTTSREVEVYTSNKSSISKEVSIPSLALGNRTMSDAKALTKDFSTLSSELDFEVHGLISVKKLTSSQVLFDLDNNKLYFN